MTDFRMLAITLFVESFLVACIALFVYFKNPRSRVNFIFCCYSFTGFIFLFCTAMMLLAKDVPSIIFWDKNVYLGVIFMPPLMYHLGTLIAKKENIYKRWIILCYLISLIFLPISRTDYFLSGVFRYKWGVHATAQPLHHLFIFIFLLYIIAYLYIIYIHFTRSTSGQEHNQAKYYLIASVILMLTSIQFAPAYKIEIYPVAYFFIIAYLAIVAYAIVKYRLMNIAVAITRTTIFVVIFSFVLGLPFLFANWSNEWLIKTLGTHWWIAPVALMAALGTSGPFLFLYIEKRAMAILFSEQRRYQEALRHAAVDMTRIRNLQKLLDSIITLFNYAVRVTHSAIYLYDAKSGEFVFKAGLNLKEQIKAIPDNAPLILWLNKYKEPLVYEEVRWKSESSSNPLLKKLEEQVRSLNATVVVPCFLEGKLLDILVLGDKLSGKIYTSEDLDNFSELAREVALATENALLYENIEEEVRQRTKELIDVQSQLVQAEKLATMGTLAGGVAHEINNPLTAILTNAQMLLADAKSFDADSKESLQLIEEATQRCRTIVQKLMTYAKKPLESSQITAVNLLSVTKKVIAFLGYQFEQNNIKIILSAKDEAYTVNGDHNEFEQVLTNIIINAHDAIIKVKKSGNIYINLSKNQRSIDIEIRDEGSGMPKELLPRIFDPFFTTKDVGKGLGLGLSICQSIVEKYKGKISVRSEVSKGSVFIVRIPSAESLAAAKEA
jgi:signal transduction histidine kinase